MDNQAPKKSNPEFKACARGHRYIGPRCYVCAFKARQAKKGR